MSAVPNPLDPSGLAEFSVVYTDRALNHMSRAFQEVMREIHAGLCRTHGAERAVVVPGGGTFAMESVARQFADGRKVLVLRNGFFSYRWSQILQAGAIPSEQIVLKARRVEVGPQAPFAPPPAEEAAERIRAERPQVVFAPHVETASGIILPDGYVRTLADATHAVGGLFVLDGVASGCVWPDMRALDVDVLISAPQKNWSAAPGAGLVMLGPRALPLCAAGRSSSFAADLGRWLAVMEAYLEGGHAYHATLPTGVLHGLRNALREAEAIGLSKLRDAQWALGKAVRGHLATLGVQSVAAAGFGAPGVVVSYTGEEEVQNGRRFAEAGLQVAAGVPLMLDEGEGFRTFRLGLFGFDKLLDPQSTLARLDQAFEQVLRRPMLTL